MVLNKCKKVYTENTRSQSFNNMPLAAAIETFVFLLLDFYTNVVDTSLSILYLDPDVAFLLCDGVKQRITIAEVVENEWFKKGYKPVVFEEPDVTLDDIDAVFDLTESSGQLVVERREEQAVLPASPLTMNAFDLISTSQGLNLGILFEKQMGLVKRETRFTSKCSADEIISKIEQTAGPLGFGVKKNNCKLKLQGEKLGRKGQLAVATEIFEVAPSLFMVELRKSKGDTLEFHNFYNNLSTGLKDVIWKAGDEIKEEEETKT